MIYNVRKIKKILLLLFAAITFSLNIITVNAEDKVVTNSYVPDFKEFIEDTTVGKITLDTDLDLSHYNVDKTISGSKYGFINYKYFADLNLGEIERTIDLNGHVLKFNKSSILIRAYNDDSVLNIIDSSANKTGKIIVSQDIDTIFRLEPCNNDVCHNVTVNFKDGTYVAPYKSYPLSDNRGNFIYVQESNKNIVLNFENINYTGGRLINGYPNTVTLKNFTINKANKTETVELYDGFPRIISDKSTLKLSDIIPEGYKIIQGNENISLSSNASLFKTGYISNTYIIKNINLMSVDEFADLQHGYESVSENKVTFKNDTSNNINITNVYLEDSTNFILSSIEPFSIASGTTDDTKVVVKPKKGLATGKYSTNIIAVDDFGELYVTYIEINVLNNKINKPILSSETKFENNGTTHKISFSGFDENTMTMSGTIENTESGDYTVQISPKDGYCWEDGSTDAINFEWQIFDRIDITNINIISNKFVIVNKEYQMEAEITPTNASYKTLNWSVENGTGTATITQDGILKPLTKGTITVKATSTFDNNMYITKELYVISSDSVNSIILTTTNYYIKNNSTVNINGYVNGKISNNNLEWSSSNPAIATVTNGNVITKSTGTVTITATATDGSGVYEEIKLYVYDDDEHTKFGIIGEKMRIEFYSNTKYSSNGVEWQYSDRSLFESSAGYGTDFQTSPYKYYLFSLVPQKSGYSNIKLVVKNQGTILGDVDVYTYNPIKEIISSYSEIILEKNEYISVGLGSKLTGITEEFNGLYYIVENDEIAFVDGSGRITGLKTGNTNLKILSKYNDKELIIPISVVDDKNNYQIYAEKITISGESENLRVGNSFNYEATLFPTNTTNKDIIWSVENGTGTATITQDGILTALSDGTATIKATATDGSGVVGEKEISMKTYIDVEKILLKTPNLFVSTDTSFYMNALIYPTTATNKKVKWSSSDTSIAEIDSDTGGLVTKYKAGTVTITATATDGSGVVGSIVLHVGQTGIKLGETTSLGNSNYITHDQVLWEIGDETILQPTGQTGSNSINNYYKHYIYVKGLKPGQTTLTMKTIAGTTIATTTVYVYSPISSLSSNISSLELQKGETKQLEIQILPDVVSDEMSGLIYISSDDSIISVDQNGNVTSHKNGRANITVYSQYNNVSLTIPVTVTTSTTGLELDSYNVDLNQEKTSHQIIYEVLPADASNKNVTFTSSNPNVATVNDTGLITALRNGTTTITVKTEDGKHEKQIIVNVTNMSRLIEDLEFNEIQSVQYNGSEIKPNIIINDEDYTLVSGTDYEIEYRNNINIGTAEIIITGINAYKGTKTITFTITKADLNVNYTAMSNTVTYDGNKHGISLDIQSPNNIIVKYADDQGNYTLDNMPKYDKPGEYTIYFELSLGNNYKTIRDSKVLIISKKNLTDKTVDLEVPYGVYNENTISVSIEEPIYSVYYKQNSDDYTSLLPPTFITPGSYTVHYKVLPGLPDIYNTLYGSRKVNIFGIVSVDPALTYIHEKQILIVRNYNFSISNILSKMNIFKNNDFIVDHEETNAQISKSDKVSTNDYITFTYKGARHNNIALAILGDVNGDGKISALDYVRIKNHIMGSSKISVTAELYSADLNEDSKISALDYVRIKNYIMNGGK